MLPPRPVRRALPGTLNRSAVAGEHPGVALPEAAPPATASRRRQSASSGTGATPRHRPRSVPVGSRMWCLFATMWAAAGVRDERSTTPKPPTAGVAHRDDCAQQGWRRRVLSGRWASRCSRRRHRPAAPPASAMAASPATPWPCSLTPARSSPVAPPGTAGWPAPRAAGAGPDRRPGGARHQGLPGAGHGFLTAMPWRDSHLAAGGGQVRRQRPDGETAYGRLQ
jgi:hypothetical protein